MATTHTNLTVGKTYAVTSANGCTVTDADGNVVKVVKAGVQGSFVAQTPSVELSDDDARLTLVFSGAPGGGSGGGEFDGHLDADLHVGEDGGETDYKIFLNGEETYHGLPYSRLVHRGGYVFEAWFDTLDYRSADKWMERHAPAVLGGCSSIARNGVFGRTFDWQFDDSAVLVVHTPAANGYHATLGVCGEVPGLTRDAALAGGAAVFALAPFLLVDGGNDAGLCASTNVVPHNAYGDNSRVVADPDAPTVCTLEVVRYILDHFSTVEEAAAWFTSTNFFHPAALVAGGYEQHWLVTDGAVTAAFEFINGVATVVELESTATFLTNFHVNGVTLNDDGSVYTPATQDSDHDAVSTNGVHPRGCGLERWNIINAGLANAGSKAGMASLLESLKFTKAYAGHAGTASPRWDTEWCGLDGLRCDNASSDFDAVQEAQAALYAERVRGDGKTWQTVHASVYEASTASLTLRAQEEGTDYEFVLDPAPLPTALTPATAMRNGGVYTVAAAYEATALSLPANATAEIWVRIGAAAFNVSLPDSWVWVNGAASDMTGKTNTTFCIAVRNDGVKVLASMAYSYGTAPAQS